VHVAGAAILPIISALLAGKPVVVEHHGFPKICPTGPLFKSRRAYPARDILSALATLPTWRCRSSGF
jgi:hypothetical protein